MTLACHKHGLPVLAAVAVCLLAIAQARAQDSVPPTITTQPSSRNVDAGQMVVLDVVASGTTPLFYQWLLDDIPINGQTQRQFIIDSVMPADAGTYSVIVSNAVDSVLSDPATLTVNVYPPTILRQSTNLTVIEGRLTTFSVSVIAAPPPSYQWFFDDNPIRDATNRVLTFFNPRLADIGLYFVVVSNTEASVSSEPVTLTVTPARTGPGSVDLTFQPGTGANNAITRITLQQDGRILAGGSFTSFNGANRNGLARLAPDGSLDPLFAPGFFGNGDFTLLAELPDGKIVAGKSFAGLVRWNADGTVDPGFTAADSFASRTEALAVQRDGKIVRNLITPYGYSFERLTSDGRSDFSFNPISFAVPGGTQEPIDSFHFVAAPAPEDKLVLGGPTLSRIHAHGATDLAFRATAASSRITAVFTKPDGKVFVAGSFTNISGVNRPGLALLNRDGSVDTRFNPTNSYIGTIQAMALQPDGKLLIAGTAPLARLNSDGSIDPSFDPGSGASGPISSILITPDCKILVAGSFTRFDLYDRRGIVRLNGDVPGAPTVTAPPLNRLATNGETVNLYVEASCVPPPAFEWSFNGTPLPGATNSTLVLDRVSPDSAGEYKVTVTNPLGSTSAVANVSIAPAPTNTASVDIDFASGDGADSTVRALARQSNGKLIVAGWFTRIHGIARAGIARLNADGSVDETFHPGTGPNNRIFAMAVDTSDRILVGGAFTNFNGRARSGLARLLPDGEVDTTFDIGTGIPGSSDSVRALVLQPDGNIVVAGWFFSFNNAYRVGVARLNVDGSVDQSFVPTVTDSQMGCLALQSDGKILAGGRSALFRFRTNGVSDFPNPIGIPGPVRSILVQPDGRILFSGTFVINRVSPSGSFEEFHPPLLGSRIETLRMHACGKILVGGSFGLSPATLGKYHIGRLTANGGIDPEFAPKTLDGTVFDVLVDDAKQVVIAGEFSKVDHAVRNGIARLHAEPAAPPPIFAQPVSQTTNAGRDLLLSVTVPTCSDYTFQWQRNGVDIPAATNTSLLLPGIHVWEAGEYRILARNGSYVAMSDPAQIQVVPEARHPGSTDVDFFPLSSVDGWVQSLALERDGKVLAGGSFTHIAGAPANLVARFNRNGDIDRTFNADPELFGTVYAVVAQPDGKTLAAGTFPGHLTTAFLVRLMPNGTRDTNFARYPFGGATGSGTAYAVASLPDGKILVAGTISAQSVTSSRSGIARLYANGDLDTNFSSGGVFYVFSFASQRDGRIIIGGTFTNVGLVSRPHVARLMANGRPADPTFDPGAGPNGTVMAVALARDEKVYIGGAFDHVNGYSRIGVARLNQDGSVDTSFNPGPGAGSVWALAVQPDNKLIAGGSFRYAGGLPRRGIARFNDDGTIDTSFDPGSGANAQVLALAFDPTGKIYAGGNFTDYNGFPRDGLTRVNGDMFLLNPMLIGNAFHVSAFTFYGQSYVLEFTTSLNNPTWTPLPAVLGTGSVNSFTDPSPDFLTRYYRIRTAP